MGRHGQTVHRRAINQRQSRVRSSGSDVDILGSLGWERGFKGAMIDRQLRIVLDRMNRFTPRFVAYPILDSDAKLLSFGFEGC